MTTAQRLKSQAKAQARKRARENWIAACNKLYHWFWKDIPDREKVKYYQQNQRLRRRFPFQGGIQSESK